MAKNDSLALPEDNAFGISIDAGLHPQYKQKIMVHGKFRVLYQQAGVPKQATQTLKHLVLVVSRSENYQSLTPFKEVVVFEDDVRDEGSCCSAFFNINLMDHIQFDGEGNYYILCSLGTYISNIVKVIVR
jgi:hypothetical protein